MTGRLTRFLSLSVLWAINPTLFGGCAEEASFTFDEADMLALMDTLNEETWLIENETGEYALGFELAQGTEEVAAHALELIQSAHACGNRSFAATAEACMDISSLPLDGSVTITEQSSQTVIIEGLLLTGSIDVYGLELNNAEVWLSHETGTISLSSDDGERFMLQSAEW